MVAIATNNKEARSCKVEVSTVTAWNDELRVALDDEKEDFTVANALTNVCENSVLDQFAVYSSEMVNDKDIGDEGADFIDAAHTCRDAMIEYVARVLKSADFFSATLDDYTQGSIENSLCENIWEEEVVQQIHKSQF